MARQPAFRLTYRVRQFWEALRPRVSPTALAEARAHLPHGLWRLFQEMPPEEQAHALRVFQRLKARGCTDPDVLTAALLHDVGKALQRPRLWERVVVVLAQRCCPRRAWAWGQGQARGWRRPFVLARQHPEWGAAQALAAGASSRTAELIRAHHSVNPQDPDLALLQWADEQE
ncbi:MAG: hypothetical protein GXO56_02055 [Chloroflexi bacterium]|nr:hypothetical protein [Chloroflexota bacterium]